MIAARTRNWMTIVYPDSAPDKWQEKLSELCVPAIVSPLHDKDINPDGTPKKPHWHVMLMFSGPKTEDQVQKLVSDFTLVKCKAVNDAQSMARYFIHMDNPEKYQYNADDIQSVSGADWYELVRTLHDKYQALKEITEYLSTHNINSYQKLVDYCRANNSQWFNVCCDNTIFLTAYCKSLDWTQNGDHTQSIPNRPIGPHQA